MDDKKIITFSIKELTIISSALAEKIDRIIEDNKRHGISMDYQNLVELRRKVLDADEAAVEAAQWDELTNN